MLDGGPGSTGAAFAAKPWFDLAARGGFELLIPTHRGAGLSTRLTCPEQEAPDSDQGVVVTPAEEPACGVALSQQWGDDLAAFTAYEAARDVVHLIGKTQSSGLPVFVFGASYGTVWAQRVLELDPGELSGLILEGTVPPGQNFESLSQSVDESARRMLTHCGEEPACASHFAHPPLDTAIALLGKLQDGSACAGEPPFSADELKRMLAVCIVGDPRYRSLVAPLLARLERCDAQDLAELIAAKVILLPPVQPIRDARGTLFDPRIWNHVLATQIIQTDLFRVEHSRTEIEARETDLIATTGNSLQIFDTSRVWPHPSYPRRDAPAAQSTTPILLFAGELDGQTPLSWSERTRAAYPGSVRFIEVPSAGHMTYAYAWTAAQENCSFDVFAQFLVNPQRALDTSCLAQVVGLDYAGTRDKAQAVAKEVFGSRAVIWP